MYMYMFNLHVQMYLILRVVIDYKFFNKPVNSLSNIAWGHFRTCVWEVQTQDKSHEHTIWQVFDIVLVIWTFQLSEQPSVPASSDKQCPTVNCKPQIAAEYNLCIELQVQV